MAGPTAPVDIEKLLASPLPEREDLPRSIGFWGGSAIMVGIIIGSGIFRKPTSIAQQLGSPNLILLLWVLGGILSLFGAFTYAELGTMFPRSGGIYVYIYEGLGEVLAFLFGWTYMILVKPLAAAAICMIFADHLNLLLHVQWDTRAVTCITLILLTGINTVRVNVGAGFAILLTGLKTASLAAIVLAALLLSKVSVENFVSVPPPRSLLAGIIASMISVLWAYDGWSDVASISGEVRSPQRLLPRIFVVGTAICIGLYVAVNAVYISVLGLDRLASDPTAAPAVMRTILGPWGGVALTAMIAISTLGATHCSIITGARVTFAQAQDGLLFRFLGRIHPYYQTPDVSLWAQGLLSCAAVVLIRDFDRLTDGFVFMMWIFYGSAAVSLIVLRIRRPDLPRPYRCFGYPWIPIVFILCSALMTVLAIWEDPKTRLVWLSTLLAGVPAYCLWRNMQKSRGSMPGQANR